MPVVNMLDLSTAHIKQSDANLLDGLDARDANAKMGVIAYPYAGGYMVSTGPFEFGEADTAAVVGEMTQAGFSQAFVDLLKHAHSIGTVMVRLDMDAPVEPGLVSFDWDTGEEIAPEEAPAPRA